MSNVLEHMDCSEESSNGFIPIRFTLCSLDRATVQAVHDVYVLASRYGYLNHSAETAIEYFRSFAIDIKSNIWFECNGIPLKSHLPIGVLYDLYHNIESPLSSSSSSSTSSSTSSSLPRNNIQHVPESQVSSITSWNITINFNRYPFDKLLKCETKEQCKDYYFHALKQSLHLIYGSTCTFTSISIENQQVLWNSTCEGRYKNYNNICKLYNLIPLKETMRIIPIRLIIHTTTHTRSVQDPPLLPPPSLKSEANETAATTTDTKADSSNFHFSANIDSTPNDATANIFITHHTQTIQRPIHVYTEQVPIPTPSSSPTSILSTTVSSSSTQQIKNQQQQDTHTNNTSKNENDAKAHVQLPLQEMMTLEQVLQKLITPHLLQHYDLNDNTNQTNINNISSTNENIIDSSSSSTGSSSRSSISNIEGHRLSLESRVLIQGVNVPLSAPIYEVWCLLHHADLFLYIALNYTEIKL